MRCAELLEHLERLAPRELACPWDNPGLLAGREDKEVSKLLIALDATDQVVDLAAEGGYDFLLTHHPLIFSPIKQINDRDFTGRRLIKLIQADISCYAMHTNFDCAPEGMAHLAGSMMGLTDTEPLEKTGEDEKTGLAYGIGICGNLEKAVTLKDLALAVKERFHLPFVNVYGAERFPDPIKRIAVCPGSGKGMAKAAKAMGAGVLITGDIGHHDGIDAEAMGVAVIDGGHYGLEHIFMDFMEGYIREHINAELTIKKAPVSFPVTAW